MSSILTAREQEMMCYIWQSCKTIPDVSYIPCRCPYLYLPDLFFHDLSLHDLSPRYYSPLTISLFARYLLATSLIIDLTLQS